MLNWLKGKRTLLFGVGTVALALLQMPEWRFVLPDGWMPYVLLLAGIISIVLRFMTNTSVWKDK